MPDESLFPADMEEMVIGEDEIDESNIPTEYIGGVAFDSDLVRDGKNAVQEASGLDSWKQWCTNCLSAERYSSPIYSTDFGISLADIYSAPTKEEAEAIFRAEAKEALEADPYGRTDHVGAINFIWGNDSVDIYIEIIGIEGATIDFAVTLGGR